MTEVNQSPLMLPSLRMNAEQRMLAEKQTEVLDSMPAVQKFSANKVVPAILGSPDIATNVVLLGGSGVGKGVIASQAAVDLLRNTQLSEGLKNRVVANKPSPMDLRLHYTSTVRMFLTAIERGIIDGSKWPHYDDIEMARVTAFGNTMLANAEAALPYQYADQAPVIFEEYIGITDPVDIGTRIVKRQGKNTNAFFIFVVTNPQIQERAYLQRKGLWTPGQDKAGVLLSHNTVIDTSTEEVITSMGNHETIEVCNRLENQAMYDAYVNRLRRFPLEVQIELSRRGIDQASKEQLQNFFDNLTIVSDDGLHTDSLRPLLQHDFYEYLATERWGISTDAKGSPNYLIIMPPFLEGKAIHYHSKFLKQFSLPYDVYASPTPPWLASQGDVFVRQK